MRARNPGRLITICALALAATFGVSACGGASVSKSQVVAKLKGEKEAKGMSDKFINCVAGALIKHGNKGDVKKYVDGKKKLDDVRQASGSDKSIQTEMETCVK
jgi:hypothetical protein